MGGIFPVPGVTSGVCVVLILIFKTNPVITQVLNLLATPLCFALVTTFINFGENALGFDKSDISPGKLIEVRQTDKLRGPSFLKRLNSLSSSGFAI